MRELFFQSRPRVHNRASRHKLNYAAQFSFFQHIIFDIVSSVSFVELVTRDAPTQRNLLLWNYESRQTGLALEICWVHITKLGFCRDVWGVLNRFIAQLMYIFHPNNRERKGRGWWEIWGAHLYTEKRWGGNQEHKKIKIEKRWWVTIWCQI